MRSEIIGAGVIIIISIIAAFSMIQLKQDIIESDKGLWVTGRNTVYFENGIQATFKIPMFSNDYRINDIKYPNRDTIHIDNRVILNQTVNFNLDNFDEVVTLLRDNGAIVTTQDWCVMINGTIIPMRNLKEP